MNTKLIELFNAAIPEKSTMSFAAINAEAIQRGYIVEPGACTDSVYQYLRSISINPNATFYKKWEDITSKTRFELLIDQLFHYMTTYGTGFALGNGYVPNDGEIDIQDSFSSFKVIKAITPEELYDKCFKMLTSGIALKQDTMSAVADYIISQVKANKAEINVDEIKNREALVYICQSLGICPNDKFALFRYIMYVTTGSTMIIKNRSMINSIKNSSTPFDFTILNDAQMRGLASIFLRYKDLFLAFKHVGDTGYNLSFSCNNANKLKKMTEGKNSNSKVINKLRKMAVKLHEPMKEGFWQTVFSKEYDLVEISKHLEDLTPYKKVAIMQTCMERSFNSSDQVYIVRNQKSFVRTGYTPSRVSSKYIHDLYAILRMSLVEDIKKNAFKEVTSIDPKTGETVVEQVAKVVKTSEGVSLSLPTSEKSFIGNYPFGTSYDMTRGNTIIGIYWKNSWGTRDYDLSFININGSKIGWNASYYNDKKTMVFSGDMTNAEPEATELLYLAGTDSHNGIVNVNQFSGEIPSKFRLFVAQEPVTNLTRNYMVKPSSIRLNVEIPVESKQIQNAIVANNKVVLMSLRSGNGIVSGYSKYTTPMVDSILRKAECFIDAKAILEDAGFVFVDDTYTGNVDIDYANLDKDSFISIMA